MANDITSANASLTIISVLGSIDVTKFSADGIIDADTTRIAETRIGVDGQMAAGYMPQIKHAVLHLEATSNGCEYLMNLRATSEASKTPMAVTMTVTVPSMNKRFVCTGYLVDVPPMFNLGTTVQPMDFGFDLQDIIKTSI
jgi:hypothetical protein